MSTWPLASPPTVAEYHAQPWTRRSCRICAEPDYVLVLVQGMQRIDDVFACLPLCASCLAELEASTSGRDASPDDSIHTILRFIAERARP